MLVEAQSLVSQLRQEIPLTGAMRVGVRDYDGQRLVLTAPLDANINDKGTAFAGSIAALANLAGWALLTLWVEERVGDCQIAIYRSEMEYRKPIRGDFFASVSLPDPVELESLTQALDSRGKGRIDLRVELGTEEGVAASMRAGYAVWTRTGD